MKATLFVLAFICACSWASNYPPEYSHQTVRTLSKGPALFAHIGSGILSQDVIGYRNNGVLAKLTPKPNFIDAIITTECERKIGNQHEKLTKTTTIKLGPEWHGTGYMTPPHSYYSYVVDFCPVDSLIKVAFSDGNGHWDSKEGADYRYRGQGFRAQDRENEGATEDKLHEGDYQISLKAWDIIVKKMKEGQ